MADKIFVFSTLTAAVNYNVYSRAAADLPVVERTITIQGGANLMTKNLMTPRGVVTEITGEELALLEENQIFQLHRENGFITVSESNGDADKVAADMTTRDESAPLVDGDFQGAEVAAPTTGARTGKRK